MELISIIVPVYNVEKYLNQCIESIVNQTYQNLEIILVDDGSTDQSAQICDMWKEKDDRIQVLHIANGGAGNARNRGFEVAIGEWVAFVDSDDYIESHMLEHLYQLCDDEVDLAECCIVETNEDKTDFTWGTEIEGMVVQCSAKDALSYHIEDKLFKQTPPNKLYRRQVVEDIPFPTGKLIDDEFWTYRVIGKCRQLVHSSYRMYAYRQQMDSVMHRSYSIKRLQAIDAKVLRLQYIQEKYPELVPVAKKNLWSSCIYQGQMSLKYLTRGEKVNAFKKLKRYCKENSLTLDEIRMLKLDYRVWVLWSKISIRLVCRLRNMMKIGL